MTSVLAYLLAIFLILTGFALLLFVMARIEGDPTAAAPETRTSA